ncbi:MAG: 23S rRNA (guanosine(2251)-2'-O)-methyltransferase RlmB [Deltaproteobacteria bacterium]|nr:23S rRNA (guanosine(2251)-2'-O)-methyltransferase RlmB [Deltaproteobacteria bacterium]
MAGSSRRDDDFLVGGINAVDEILRRRERPLAVLFCRERPGPRLAALIDRAKAAGATVKTVPDQQLDRLCGHRRHQGVVARVAPVAAVSLEKLLASLDPARQPVLLAVDEIKDPQNLGSIIRTAAAAGAAGLLLPDRRTAGLSPTVAKVASGGLEYLPVCRVGNLVGALEKCRERGFWLAGTVVDGGTSIYAADLRRPLVLVVGSEARGLRPLVRRTCDLLLTIPMHAALNSLNVAAATAVVLFEIRRQQDNGAAGRGE